MHLWGYCKVQIVNFSKIISLVVEQRLSHLNEKKKKILSKNWFGLGMLLPENKNMFFRFLIHLVFVSVFLFWSTFSCTAFASEEVWHWHHDEVIQEKTSDDCCPKDGHKKQIEWKNIIQTLQKQGFDIEHFIPKNEKTFFDKKTQTNHQVSYYQSPQHDRQSLFFIDTIRLLL